MKRRNYQINKGPTGPKLDLPVCYDFTTAPAPRDHVVKHRHEVIALPRDSFVRGIEVGLGALDTVLIHLEWSEPVEE